MATVDLSVTVIMAHQKASSQCHGAKLAKPAADQLELPAFDGIPADEQFTCTECGQPAARVLGDPVTVTATNG